MNLSLSKATRNDILDIINIANEHFFSFGHDGFLISNYTYDSISNIMMNPNSIIYVTKLDDVVVSFLILSKIYHVNAMNNIELNQYHFDNPEDEKLLTSFKHWHMEQGAVRKELLNTGIGSFYYEEIFNLYPDHSFSSNVVSKPIRNTASINIKYKFNFRAAGFLEKAEHKNLKDFKMILFIRDSASKQKKDR